MTKRWTVLAVAGFLSACGGGEPAQGTGGSMQEASPAEAAAPAASANLPGGELTMPDWFQYDADANSVHMTITAGLTPDLNHWNFNGYTNGAIAITVPEGASVTIDFENKDPAMAHSLGISAAMPPFQAMLEPAPAFEGALTENPTSMTEGTMPGESETITFTASEAGTYTMLCYIPGHATTGMWVYFVVSAEGEAGVRGGM